jgi:hypothetical protein
MRWTEHVARLVEIRNANVISVAIYKGEIHLCALARFRR